MAKYFKPKAVMSIHGYLSTGKWQNELSKAIISQGLDSYEFKYGFTVKFDKYKVSKLIDGFRNWYFGIVNDPENEIDIDKPYHRPSIVAHSLGTWILAKALLKYPEIKFDKIFLHGSIIPRNLDWYSLIMSDRVDTVIVEKSKKDGIVRFGVVFTGSLYPCCKYGFIQESTYIKYENSLEFKHSDFQYQQHFISQFKKYLYSSPFQMKIIGGEELEMKGLQKYFKQTIAIDHEVYGLDYINNDPVTLEAALRWAQIEKGIWSFLVESYSLRKENVLGYINTMAVDDETYENFIDGKLSEANISPAGIKSFKSGGKLNIIILSIALSNSAKNMYGGMLNSKPGELLLMALSKKLTDLKNKNQNIQRIACVAWTDIGENLCNSFGLSKSDISYQGRALFTSITDEIRKKNKSDLHPLSHWWVAKL